MKSGIEKVTLSLDRRQLGKMAKRAKKSMSEFVRDLIQREKELNEDELNISKEILELKGSLKPTVKSTKDRVHRTAKGHLRKF